MIGSMHYALCINQNDVPERNQQVAQMQEIYAGAEKVLIWLGEPKASIPLDYPFVQALCDPAEKLYFNYRSISVLRRRFRKLELLMSDFSVEQFINEWVALADLIQRPWWGRTWVSLMSSRANFLI